MADSLAAPFNGMVFTEILRGGRRLVTYAYTDVENPKSESFARAYGRLVTAGAYVLGGSEDSASTAIQGPPIKPILVKDPGAIATPGETDAYTAYLTAQDQYEADLIVYERELKEVSPADLVGHPLKGLPVNTVEADNIIVADDTEGTGGTVAQVYFWNTLGSFTDSNQPPQLPAGVNPVANDQIHVPEGPLSQGIQYYRPIAFTGGGEPSELSAIFDGVPGLFICSAADADLTGDLAGLCSITVRPGRDGAVYSATGTWKFVATNSGATVLARRQDADYLLLGWWVEEPVSATGDVRFGRFFSGSDPFTAGNISGLGGTAKYVGPAVGKWATREEGSLTAEKGVFKATADLAADFDENIISGQVRDFDIPGFNAVVVMAPNMADEANITEATFTGVTRGEAAGQDWAGTWRGAFYGNDRYRERVEMRDSPQGYPGYASGLFNAYFGCPEADCPVDADLANPRAGELGFVGVSGVFGAEYTETAETE